MAPGGLSVIVDERNTLGGSSGARRKNRRASLSMRCARGSGERGRRIARACYACGRLVIVRVWVVVVAVISVVFSIPACRPPEPSVAAELQAVTAAQKVSDLASDSLNDS